jgi:hypothetical protein
MIHLSGVLLHVIEHCILTILGYTALKTDKLPLLIPRVLIGHRTRRLVRRRAFKFLVARRLRLRLRVLAPPILLRTRETHSDVRPPAPLQPNAAAMQFVITFFDDPCGTLFLQKVATSIHSWRSESLLYLKSFVHNAILFTLTMILTFGKENRWTCRDPIK